MIDLEKMLDEIEAAKTPAQLELTLRDWLDTVQAESVERPSVWKRALARLLGVESGT